MKRPLRVAALTSGRNVPSARFRIRQHIASLARLGIEVHDHVPRISQHARLPGRLGQVRQRYLPPIAAGQVLLNAVLRIPGAIASHRADATWIERNFVPGLESAVVATKRPRVLDVDDAIWLSTLFGQGTTRRLARNVDAVIAGNAYLAEWYGAFCENVSIVPTAIDCDRFRPGDVAHAKNAADPFVIGWTGTAGNFRFLQDIERPLADFLRAHPSARFRVVADRRPALPSLPGDRLEFVQWTPENEASSLRGMDVGLMPLVDDEWTRGKCSYKMLQYMATGLPVIASPVGMNAEVLAMGACGIAASSPADWFDALSLLASNDALRAACGATGRTITLASFDLPVVAERIANVFGGLT